MATNQEWQIRFLKESEAKKGQQFASGSQKEMEARFQELKSNPDDTLMAALYNERGIRVDGYEHPATRMPK